MPALTLDIKTPNTLEKMALKTAKALDAVAAREVKINALMAKGMKTGKVSAELAKKTSQQIAKYKKQIIEQSAREIAQGKQKSGDDKKQISFLGKLSQHYLIVKDAVMGAYRAAKALTLGAIEDANALSKTTKALKFQVDLWTSGTKKGAQFAEIEKYANKTGIAVTELSAQWLKFRQASTPIRIVDNKASADMLRVYTDIRALSGSAEVASDITGQWMEKFKEGPDIAARFLKQIQGAHKGWEKIGTGTFKMDPSDAQAADDQWNKFHEKVMKAIAPLTKMFNELSGKLAKALGRIVESKEFKNFIADLVTGIKYLVDVGLPALKKAITDFWDFWSGIGKKLAESDFTGKFFDLMYEASKAYDKLFPPEPKAAPTPEAKPKYEPPQSPAKKTTTGMNERSLERQLAGITIQNLNVTGGDAQENGRAVRQELQLLLQAGALSKGYA
jgi:hypothetical protein